MINNSLQWLLQRGEGRWCSGVVVRQIAATRNDDDDNMNYMRQRRPFLVVLSTYIHCMCLISRDQTVVSSGMLCSLYVRCVTA